MTKLKILILALCTIWVTGCGSDSISGDIGTPTTQASLALIQVNPVGKAIAKGTTQQLTATGVFSNGVSQSLTNTTTWTSSNPAIATVTNTGLVTGVAPGEVNLIATTSGINGTAPLTVTTATLSSVSVTPANATVARGTTQQFRFVGSFSDSTTQDLTSAAAWSTSPAGLASVNNLGLATANNVGVVNVTGTFNGQSASGVLTITAATLQNISVFPAAPSVARGFSVQAGANATFSDGTVQNITNTAAWSSSDTTIANVSAAGNVSANNVGVANITATQGAVSSSTTITVSQASLVSLAISPAGPSNVTLGGQLQLTATGTFSDATTLDLTSAATWASNNTAVAAVTNAAPIKGTVSGVALGSTQIGAVIPNTAIAASTTVTVVPPASLQANLVGLDQAGTSLVKFNSGSAGTITTTAITGLTAGDTLVGLDVRPLNRFLYGLGFNNVAGTVQLYAVDPNNGRATPVGTAGGFVDGAGNPAAIQGTDFGFDFNPSVDRIRVVTNTGQNFRMNPNTGAFIDGDLGGAAGSVAGVNQDGPINGGTTTVDGAAYTNNAMNNGGVTTLYTLDAITNALYIQNPPNAGTQANGITVTLGGNTLDFTASNGFDIAAGVNVPASNAAVTSGSGFAALEVGGATGLYGINLVNGAALNLGPIGSGATPLRGLTALQDQNDVNVIALQSGNLGRLNSTTPGTSVSVAITGVTAGETIVGIDYRPSTGQLFGLGINATTDTGTLYRIDPQTGATTVIGAAGQIAFVNAAANTVDLADPAVVGYGFDFNPTVDRVRVTSDSGLNFRLNPITGAPVDGDAVAAGINPDGNINGGAAGVNAAAYTNNFAGATVTTLYTLVESSDGLFIQNPPNAGTQVPVGPLGVNFTTLSGFDIPHGVQVAASNAVATGNGFAILTVGGNSGLYTINLTTGTATLLGGVFNTVSGMTVSY